MKSAPHRPATAADVAALAGVSRATVSHIFTGREQSFAESTRERVLRAARELDYRPSPAGRSLVLGHGDTIIALVPRATIGQNHLKALDRLTADTASIGANVVMRFAEDDPEETVSAVLRMRPLAVVSLGVALPPSARQRLEEQGVPLSPSTGDTTKERARHFDDLITEIQVKELVKSGAQHIVYVSIDDGLPDVWSPLRLEALAIACARHGLDEPQAIRLSAEFEKAAVQFRACFNSPHVGIAAFNDEAAVAAMNLAVRHGAKVPADVAVIGVDATPLAQLVSPRLTTIKVDMYRFMDDAVAHLSQRLGLNIEATGSGPHEPFQLVRGEST